MNMQIRYSEQLFLNALDTQKELTTKEVCEKVGCSVQHCMNMLKLLKAKKKIRGRQLSTKAFLWQKK